MSHADAVGKKGLGNGWDQLGQFDAPLHIGFALSGAGGNRRQSVGGIVQIQQGTEAERLLQRMNVLALQVFDDLRFDGLGIGQCDHAHRDGIERGEFGGTQPPRPGDDLVFLLFQLAHQKRRENALALEALCQLPEVVFVEAAARVGGRLHQHADGQVAVFVDGDVVCGHSGFSFRFVVGFRHHDTLGL